MGEDGEMFCFDAATAEVERVMKVSDKEVIGLAHHPHRWRKGGAIITLLYYRYAVLLVVCVPLASCPMHILLHDTSLRGGGGELF